MTKLMDLEPTFTKMELLTQGNGNQICKMGTELNSGQMVANMKAFIALERSMELDSISESMGHNTMDNEVIIKSADLEFINESMEENIMESG